MKYLKWLSNEMDGYHPVYGNEEDAFIPDFRPVVDVEENKKQYKLLLELPGLNKKDIKLNIKGNILTVSGEKKEIKRSEKNRLHRNERKFGKFQRSFRVPKDVNQTKITAEFSEGVLNITMEKSEELLPKELNVSIK